MGMQTGGLRAISYALLGQPYANFPHRLESISPYDSSNTILRGDRRAISIFG